MWEQAATTVEPPEKLTNHQEQDTQPVISTQMVGDRNSLTTGGAEKFINPGQLVRELEHAYNRTCQGKVTY